MLVYKTGESRVGTGFRVAGGRTQRLVVALSPDPRPQLPSSRGPRSSVHTAVLGSTQLSLCVCLSSHSLFFFHFCLKKKCIYIYIVGLQHFWSLSFTLGALFLCLGGTDTPGNVMLLKFARSRRMAQAAWCVGCTVL